MSKALTAGARVVYRYEGIDGRLILQHEVAGADCG
jgi:hypothetical protein